MPTERSKQRSELLEFLKNDSPNGWFLQEGWAYCESCFHNGMLSPFEIHHIVLISQGGGDGFDNLINLCRGCHNQAHGKGHCAFGAVDVSQANLKTIVNERNERWNPKH